MPALVGGRHRVARPRRGCRFAHNGVLFLDEFPEFATPVLDSLPSAVGNRRSVHRPSQPPGHLSGAVPADRGHEPMPVRPCHRAGLRVASVSRTNAVSPSMPPGSPGRCSTASISTWMSRRCRPPISSCRPPPKARPKSRSVSPGRAPSRWLATRPLGLPQIGTNAGGARQRHRERGGARCRRGGVRPRHGRAHAALGARLPSRLETRPARWPTSTAVKVSGGRSSPRPSPTAPVRIAERERREGAAAGRGSSMAGRCGQLVRVHPVTSAASSASRRRSAWSRSNTRGWP